MFGLVSLNRSAPANSVLLRQTLLQKIRGHTMYTYMNCPGCLPVCQVKKFYAPSLKGPPQGPYSNQILRLSVRPFVHNSVQPTEKEQYLKFGC